MGDFCLVLHGHLPWVLHHGYWPHGEFWLYEAAAETWLPLISLIDGCARDGIRSPITLGLMPVLLEQLAHPTFRAGFPRWLRDRQQRARLDEQEFTARNELHLAWLASRWQQHFVKLEAHFDAIGSDITRAFADHARAGRIELLTSNATHGFMPLILHDASSRAQIRAGIQTSARHFGFCPRGAWLPECAYRPSGPWQPPVVHDEPRLRDGVEVLFSQEGVQFFFVDSNLFDKARSEGIVGPWGFEKVGWDRAAADPARGWRSVLEPHGISSDGGPARLTALARHPEVSEQVWSGVVGYPGDGRYLEFHKKHGNDGLRYWRVTSPRAGLGEKEAYYPDAVAAIVQQQARHFTATVRSLLDRWQEQSGRRGVVTAPFDAELFGHWWAEGPAFLREVFRCMAEDAGVRPCTVSERLAESPPDKVVTLPAGSWGEGGDFRVWWNEPMRWVWEAMYRAEDRFIGLLHALPWRTEAGVEEALKLAGRELLLLQASDWPFVIHTKGAVDYGYRRICEHLARFDRACSVAEARAKGEEDTPQRRVALEDIRVNDDCFVGLELGWWG